MKKSPSTLIFLHIPKTAGTTFSTVLFRQYAPQACFYRTGNKISDSLDELAGLPENARQSLELIYILHAGFGIHHLLPTPSSYVSFLREPWSRLISDYFHACRNSDHSFYAHAQAGATIDDFVFHRLKKQGLTNPMTRFISGINPYQPFHSLPVNALDVAIDNIERHFGFLGLTEQYDESLLLIKQHYKWGNIQYLRKNVGKKNVLHTSFHPATLASFQEGNAMDYSLYAYAKQKLEQSLQQQGPGFWKELKRVRDFNLMNEIVYNFIHTVKKCLTR